MDFGLLVTFRLGQERAIPLIESVEAISVVSLGMLGSSLCIRLLLRGDTLAGEGGNFATSTTDDNGKPPGDILLEFCVRRWAQVFSFRWPLISLIDGLGQDICLQLAVVTPLC